MTTMNTGAASLSDERERAAITACALMIKGICLTRPNAEWTGAIEDRIQFMLKQMQAGAAIAAGGAQEAVAWKVDGLNGYNESAPSVWLKRDNAEAAAARLFKSSITPLAGPLPRVAATAWQPIETAPKDGTEVWAFNGEQARMLWSEGEEWSLWVWADQLLADADPEPDQPTHWQPLPSAPAAPNGEKA